MDPCSLKNIGHLECFSKSLGPTCFELESSSINEAASLPSMLLHLSWYVFYSDALVWEMFDCVHVLEYLLRFQQAFHQTVLLQSRSTQLSAALILAASFLASLFRCS
jgi:hypothetical protein